MPIAHHPIPCRPSRLSIGFLVLLASGLFAAPALSADLKVGDPAPPFQPGNWIKGDPVKQLDKGTIYVIEFWATWCGPCRESIPHVSQLQAQYKDKNVVIIGQNVLEQKADAVAPFVKEMGDKMNYRVCTDTVKGANPNAGVMIKTWLDAAGQDGIPTAFVIDKQGRIAWIGHPMMGLDDVVKGLVDGTFDTQKEAQKQARIKTLHEQIQKLMQTRKWDDALKAVNRLARLAPDDEDLPLQRLEIFCRKDDLDAARDAAEKLFAENKDDPPTLASIVSRMVGDGQDISRRILDLASTLITRASEAAKGEDPDLLSAVARVQFFKGDAAKAIQTLSLAIKKSSDPEQKKQFRDALKQYRVKSSTAATRPDISSIDLAADIDDDAVEGYLQNQAAKLMQDPDKSGVVDCKTLIEQLKNAPRRIDIPAPAMAARDWAELYAKARAGVVVVASVFKCDKCNDWHVNGASGFVLRSDGLIVTNYHVIDQHDQRTMIVMTAKGTVYPVKEVLAANECDDIAVIRIDAKDLFALPLCPECRVGQSCAVISHPDGRYYTMATGIVTRKCILTDETGPAARIQISAEYAKGSSGGPVFNSQGQVIAFVASTESIYYDDADGQQANLQMVVRSCVPVQSVIRLISSSRATTQPITQTRAGAFAEPSH